MRVPQEQSQVSPEEILIPVPPRRGLSQALQKRWALLLRVPQEQSQVSELSGLESFGGPVMTPVPFGRPQLEQKRLPALLLYPQMHLQLPLPGAVGPCRILSSFPGTALCTLRGIMLPQLQQRAFPFPGKMEKLRPPHWAQRRASPAVACQRSLRRVRGSVGSPAAKVG